MFIELFKSNIKTRTKKAYKRGDIIYSEGDYPKNIYFIESGLVGLFHLSESGKETFLRVFGQNSLLGHRSFFAKENYHANAIALSSVELTVVSQDECERVCIENFQLLRSVTTQLAIDLGNAELRLAGLQDKSAHKRIAESLVYLKSRYPNQVWTRKEIAEYAGSTFETVTRVMTILENQGLLKKIGRDFEIFDGQKILTLNEKEIH